ncbi:MAG TPA: SAM-dependent methyltransferase [Ignavibacteria bacterium]
MDDDKNKFLNNLSGALTNNTFIKLTFSKYRGKDPGLENIYITPVQLKEGVRLSFRYKFTAKDEFHNYDFEEGEKLIARFLGTDFLSAHLFTSPNDFIIEFNKKREPRLYINEASAAETLPKAHNREKIRFIDKNSRYLNLLGITNEKGEIKKDKYDKFRQTDKFIEIVDSLCKDSGIFEKEEIKIMDFGSGKSYLTFALYDYFANTFGKKTDLKGVEERKELVDFSNEVSNQSGFLGLMFYKGLIINFPPSKSDIVVALHACDTATDEAIAKAISSFAEIIILAPCCHKYVRKQIKIPQNLNSIFKHGIIEEHVSSFITDGLRSLMLEAYGYKTKIFEFISSEHTAKNIMITAVKSKPAASFNENKIKEIENVKSQFGLKDFYLDKILK